MRRWDKAGGIVILALALLLAVALCGCESKLKQQKKSLQPFVTTVKSLQNRLKKKIDPDAVDAMLDEYSRASESISDEILRDHPDLYELIIESGDILAAAAENMDVVRGDGLDEFLDRASAVMLSGDRHVEVVDGKMVLVSVTDMTPIARELEERKQAAAEAKEQLGQFIANCRAMVAYVDTL